MAAMMRLLLLLLLLVGLTSPAAAQEGGGCAEEAGTCAITEPDAGADAPAERGALVFFWGVGCPHCEEAAPLLDELAAEHPELRIERVEVRRDAAGRARFMREVERLGIEAPGVPAFVYGDAYVLGYRGASSAAAVRALVADAGAQQNHDREGSAEPVGLVDLPLVGTIDSQALSLPALTLLIGLVVGINPCAMYVLLVLLSILLSVKQRERLLLFGAVFVIMSGVVYFLFMTVWIGLFQLVGLSRTITIALGVAIAAMGLINLKELVWFKKGVSLVIPERAKPGLFRRMRAIAHAASLPAALAGIVALAFVVNLIELGCTLGLPAIYTRILSLRADVSPAGRYAYLALYNAAYVVPLGLIVGVYAATFRRITLSERGAKVLKAVSGTLLLLFGILFIAAPEVLG
jgi:thiol-disulfide isomerase/thioredoxin